MDICVVCGEKTATEVTSTRTVDLLGHDEIYEFRSFECSSCGESFTSDGQSDANEAGLRRATVRALAVIGADEIRQLRELVQVTQAELENALGLGRNTVARWETGQRPVPPYIKNMLRLVALNPAALILLREQDVPPGDRMEMPIGGTLKAAPARYERSAEHLQVVRGDEDDRPDPAKVIAAQHRPAQRSPWSDRTRGRKSLVNAG